MHKNEQSYNLSTIIMYIYDKKKRRSELKKM